MAPGQFSGSTGRTGYSLHNHPMLTAPPLCGGSGTGKKARAAVNELGTDKPVSTAKTGPGPQQQLPRNRVSASSVDSEGRFQPRLAEPRS